MKQKELSAKLLVAITQQLPIVGEQYNMDIDIAKFFENEYPCSDYQKMASWNYSPLLTDTDKAKLKELLENEEYFEIYKEYIYETDEYI
ncbi:MAG: hypothetical protein WCG87_10630, partial [Bacteroidota bacterium]